MKSDRNLSCLATTQTNSASFKENVRQIWIEKNKLCRYQLQSMGIIFSAKLLIMCINKSQKITVLY